MAPQTHFLPPENCCAMLLIKKTLPLFLLILLGISQHALAQSVWGGSSGNWNSGPNWQNGSVPNNATHSALLGGSNSYSVLFDQDT